ncbi:glycosyltransferase family 2 protein [Solimonas soli]|uniref:glycosyltransferase family 2 protein n=1 Tax=Solimonas soli TaxID=413479 RepID=UPI0004809074|nr:glycosyltransferase [Solimonas soli]
MSVEQPSVSVCIATYRRPAKLALLLDDLAAQTRPPAQVVVVDNDAGQSARPAIDRARGRGLPYVLQYATQSEKNISLARNLSVRLARGDWLALIDDDERAGPQWLARLVDAAARYRADGVLGPVEPQLPAHAPGWILRGRFYEWARFRSGTPVPPNRLRLGNALLSATALRGLHGPFDPAYGLTGGEDGDLLSRLVRDGARIVWCDEATVQEPVDDARLSLRWLLRRALRGGQDFARHTLAGRYGPATPRRRLAFTVRAAAQLLAAGALTIVSVPFGRHRAARWLLAASANFGKLTQLLGLHYREYA